MPIVIACESCGSKYRVNDEVAGKKVKCKKCGEVITVERPSAAPLKQTVPQAARPATKTAPAKSAGTTIDDEDGPSLGFRDDEEEAAPAPVIKPRIPKIPAAKPKPAPEISAAREEERSFSDLAALGASSSEEFAPEPYVPPRAPAFAPAGAAPSQAAAWSRPAKRVVLSSERPPWADSLLGLMAGSSVLSPFISFVIVAIYVATKSTGPVPGSFYGALFGTAIFLVVFTTCVVAPLMLLGSWLSSKISSFRLESGSYTVVLGILGFPAFVGMVGEVLFFMTFRSPNASFVPVILLGLSVLSCALVILLIKNGFGITWPQTVVTALMSGLTVFIGTFVVSFVLILVIGVAGMFRMIAPSPDQSSSNVAQSGSGWSTPPSRSREAYSPPPQMVTPMTAAELEASKVSLVDSQLDSLRHRSKVNMSFAKYRERADSIVFEAEREISQLRASDPVRATQAKTQPVLDEIKAAYLQLPSLGIPTDLNTAPAQAENWTLDDAALTALGAPVRYRQWSISTGPLAKLDLTSAEEGEGGVKWDFQEFNTSLRIETIPEVNPSQVRPWVVMDEDQKNAAIKARMQYVESSPDAGPSTVGKIGDILFTRTPRKDLGQGLIIYMGKADKNWIRITLSSRGNAQIQAAMEQAVRSIRPVGDRNVPGAFSPERVVARLADDAQHAMPLLKQAGAAAEPAMIAGLAHTDARVRKACAEILGDAKSEKALEPLLALAHNSADEASGAARDAARKISPTSYDEVDEAIADLKKASVWGHEKSLKSLAAAKPDEKRREVVAAALEGILINDDRVQEGGAIGAALKVWQGAKTIDNLIAAISVDDDAHSKNRDAILKALAATGEKKAAKPIARWILKSPFATKAALITLGPAAEDDVIPLLRGEHRAKSAAIEILKEVGTKKSLSALNSIANDKAEFFDADNARAAVRTIRDRETAAAATAAAAKKKDPAPK